MIYQCPKCGLSKSNGVMNSVLPQCKCDWGAPAAQRSWVGLTDDEIENVWRRTQANDFHDCVQPFARAIEAKLRSKNV